MEVTVPDPQKVETKKVDSSGKLYVGTAFSGQEVEIVIGESSQPDE